jgi:hypothetical protein
LEARPVMINEEAFSAIMGADFVSGDMVRVDAPDLPKLDGRVATFDCMRDGQAIIKVNGYYVQTLPQNIRLIQQDKYYAKRNH